MHSAYTLDPRLFVAKVREIFAAKAQNINMGEFAAARENIEKAIFILAAPASDERRGGYTSLQLLGLQVYSAHRAPESLWFLGFPDQARRRGKETLVLAQEAEPLIFAHALTRAAYIHADCGEPEAVRNRIEQLSAIVDRYGLHPHFLENANELQGRVFLLEGRYRDAVEALGNVPRAKMFLALAYAAAGDPARALETADAALARLYESEYRAYESTAHQIRGEALLVQGSLVWKRLRAVFAPRSRPLDARAPGRWNCAPRRASPACSMSRAIRRQHPR